MNHLDQTILQIQSKITQYEGIIIALRALSHSTTPAPAPASASAASEPPPIPAKTPKAIPRHTANLGKGKGFSSAAQRIIHLAGKLKEPLTTKALSESAGVPKSSANSSLMRWLKRGWLVKSAYGEYTRTTIWGTNAAPKPSATPTRPTGPTSPAIPSPAKATLEKQLQDALHARDYAREQGRSEMVEVFQNQINKLESQLS